MLRLDKTTFYRDPYPIGCAQKVFAPKVYKQLVALFPKDGFTSMSSDGYRKMTLSPVFTPQSYVDFLAGCPEWRAFYKYVKGPMIGELLALLRRHGLSVEGRQFSSRFEFSALPAHGGLLKPHRDTPKKVLTLILPMVLPGEWDPEWGGGTDQLKPMAGVWREPLDYLVPRESFELVRTFKYVPNQCVVFLRNEVSWHSVGPITGPAEPEGSWRKSVTVNVERIG